MAHAEEPTRQPAEFGYRPDVDGLRAVAVLAVVVWHAGFRQVPGGFAGVDIFFVISGFVITRTLRRDAAGGGVSLLGFYARRLRRIAPALLVLLVAVMAAALVVDLPRDLEDTSKVALGALGLIANVVLWRQGGYFGPDAEIEPLRHTWSLSVEEQFYLVYPPLLALLIACAPKRLSLTLAMLALASGGLYAVLAARAPEAAYQLGPARAWELLVGCLMALEGARWRPPPWLAEALALVGASLIAFALATRAPAPATIAESVLGAALLVGAGPGALVSRRLLAARPMVWIGLVSYSLYLWHWPLLAFATSLDPHRSLRETLALVAAGGVLAVLSWWFVERPLRRPWPDARARNRFLAGMGALAALVCAMAGAALATHGLAARFSPPVRTLAAYDGYERSPAWFRQLRQGCFGPEGDLRGFPVARCLTSATDRPNVLLWGDSHAAHFAEPLAELATSLGANFQQATAPACPPFAITGLRGPRCNRFDVLIWGAVARRPPQVAILSFSAQDAAPNEMLGSLAPRVAALRTMGVKVILLGPSPEYQVRMARALAQAWPAAPIAGLAKPTLAPFQSDAALEAQYAAAPGVTYVSLIDRLCDAQRQCRLLAAPGVPVVWDKHHMTLLAARQIVRDLLAQPLAAALGAKPTQTKPAPQPRSP